MMMFYVTMISRIFHTTRKKNVTLNPKGRLTLQDVDLIITVFERTYRNLLMPGKIKLIEMDNNRFFSHKVVLINNVSDKEHAQRLADELVASAEITSYAFVDDHLEQSLSASGMKLKDLGCIPHYSDCALVAIHLLGSPWLCYWDAEARLQQPVNWIDPAIKLMEGDRRIIVANPNWWRDGLDAETDERIGEFSLGYGFSDCVFLCRRADLSAPIYHYRTVASLRYPLSYISPVFEQRIDAFMRVNRKLRATCNSAVYIHPESEGSSYPTASPISRLRRRRNRMILSLTRKFTRKFKITNPRYRIDGLASLYFNNPKPAR